MPTPRRALPDREAVYAEKARRRFSAFFRQGWHVLEPSTPLSDNWHVDALCDHIQAVCEDWRAVQRALMGGLKAGEEPPAQRVQNLVVNIPPGTAKSRILSVYAPAWMWLEWPSWRAVFISGNPRVSLRDSVFCRELIRSAWYQSLFQPSWGTAWTLARDQDAKSLFRNTAGGLRMAIGAKSKITGDRYDCLVVDDPNDMATVDSVAERDAVNGWWDSGAGNRVNDLRYSTRVLIQQRGHEDDLSGHVLRTGAWKHLIVPMEFRRERGCACPSCALYARTGADEIGWTDPRADEGELLDARRFPPEILRQERVRLGAGGYAGQMNQAPAPEGGLIFQRGWFTNRYRRIPPLKGVASMWDLALKDREQNDETACLTYGTGEDGNPYLLRLVHGRWETPEVARFLIEQADYYRGLFGDEYQGDYVEDKVSGTTLMQFVRRMRPDLVLVPVQVEGDKVARAHGVAPLCEAGRVLLPSAEAFPATQGWAEDLLTNLLVFPNGAHDDITDVFVYALKRFLGTLNRQKSRRGKGGGMAA